MQGYLGQGRGKVLVPPPPRGGGEGVWAVFAYFETVSGNFTDFRRMYKLNRTHGDELDEMNDKVDILK